MAGLLTEADLHLTNRCIFCGCSEESPCYFDGNPCDWVILDENNHTGLCSNCYSSVIYEGQRLLWNRMELNDSQQTHTAHPRAQAGPRSR